MNEQNNNNVGPKKPIENKQPNKNGPAAQVGKNLGQMGLKAAGKAIGGPVGGMVANKIASSKLGQNALNKVGKNMANNPMMNNPLSKAGSGLQKASSGLNSPSGKGLGGSKATGPGNGSSQGMSSGNKTEDSGSNNSTSSQNSNNDNSKSSNSGFGNNKSGIFSNPFKLGGDAKGESSKNPLATFKKAKKVVGIVAAVAPIVFPIIMGILVIVIVMAQIMTVRDQIQQLARQFTTGVEKLVNFAQGDGWMTNEDSFFNYLNKEYNAYSVSNSNGGKLDIPLVAATIHYSYTVDLEQFEKTEANIEENISEEDFNVLGNAFAGDQTSAFYTVAKTKLGSTTSLIPGQKRLLGHLTKTEFVAGTYNLSSAIQYNKQFISYIEQVASTTVKDLVDVTGLNFALHPISSLLKLHEELSAYVKMYGDITYGSRYDIENYLYDIEEILSIFKIDFSNDNTKSENEKKATDADTQLDTSKDAETTENADKGIWFAIKVERNATYGYSEFKEMQRIVTEMRAIIKDDTLTDEALYKKAKDSSDENLKKLASEYEKNKNTYLYSYTHYLKEVYIPFTYFYHKEATDGEINSIIDEIYDQRDFYNYLIGKDSNDVCIGGTQAGDLSTMEMPEKINYIGPLAQLEYSRTGILASITIGQAILEADIGASTPANSNNIFGVKCGSWPKDQCVSAKTSEEYTPGNITSETALFRKYDSIEASIQDHTQVLLNGRYAGITETTDYKEQAAIIKKGGYATDAIYDKKLINVIESYDLTKWDVSVNAANSSLMCGPVVSGGWTIRTTKPTSSDIPYTYVSSNRGQCVWYVRARSIEIAQDLASKGKITTEQMEKIKSLLLNNVGGNAEAWYRSGSLYFNSSNNINNLKAGSIIVWSGGSSMCSPACGHVAIIEEVTSTEVIFTDGYAEGGSSCPNDPYWNCVGWNSRTMSINEFLTGAKNNFGSHSGSMKFEGYVYFLEPL